MSGTRPAAAARNTPARSTRGVDVGRGNGRHPLPLLHAGADMTGPDILAEAITRLRAR